VENSGRKYKNKSFQKLKKIEEEQFLKKPANIQKSIIIITRINSSRVHSVQKIHFIGKTI
jgi:hypothetical protein